MAHAAEAPRYQLIAPLYAGDEFIPEGEVIEDDDGDFVPNEHMIPLNDAAKEKFQQFMDRVNPTPDLGDIVETAYRNRPRHEITPVVPHDVHRVEMRESHVKPPLTGFDGNTKQMTNKKKSPVKSVGTAEDHDIKGPVKVMGNTSMEVKRGI